MITQEVRDGVPFALVSTTVAEVSEVARALEPAPTAAASEAAGASMRVPAPPSHTMRMKNLLRRLRSKGQLWKTDRQ